MATKKGTVLSFHASLADKGTSRGSNNAPTTQWYDLSGNGNHGILSGFLYKPESGWTGSNTLTDPYALYFNGADNYVTSPSVMFTGDFTFETVFYCAIGGTIISTGSEGDSQGVSLRFNGNNELEVYVKTSDKTTYVNLGTVQRREWTRITGSYNAEAGLLSIYKNGAPIGRYGAIEGGSTNSPTDMFIGKNPRTTLDHFNGAIALVRIYNYALSMNEVGQSYLDGYLLNSGHRESLGNVRVPHRKDISSVLKVGISGTSSARYGIIPNDSEDLGSVISVQRSKDLSSFLNISPSVRLSGRYHIAPQYSHELEGAISVYKPVDLVGSVVISNTAKASGRYVVIPSAKSDLESSLNVNQNFGNASQVTGSITVPSTGSASGRYEIIPTSYTELQSSLRVNTYGALPSNIVVPTTGKVTAKYLVNALEANDLPSSLSVAATSQITGNIKIYTTARVKAKYGVIVAGRSEIQSSITIASTTSLPSNLKVATLGRLSAKYRMTLGGENDLQSNIIVTSTEDLPSSVGISPYATVRAKYVVEGLYLDDLESSFTIKEAVDLPSILRISPMTVMTAHYEVVEPPVYSTTLKSIKDAFVRESIPRLNYGKEEQMVAGYSSSINERLRSYVAFDVEGSGIPRTNVTIQKAVLKLYLENINSKGKKIQILEATQGWAEQGITWLNQPFPTGYDSSSTAYEGIIVDHVMSGEPGYVEFDVTEAIDAWMKGERAHHGFILKSYDEKDNYSFSFITKEHLSNVPELDITYYDTRIFSFDRSNLATSIAVRVERKSDLKSAMFVRSFQGRTDVESNIFVFNPRDLFTYITVSRPDLPGHVAIRKQGHDEIDSTITVSLKGDPSEHEGSIIASKPSVPGSITVPERSDLPSSIAASQSDLTKIEASAIISRPVLEGSLDVLVWGDTDWESEMRVGRPFLDGSLQIVEKVSLDSEISVRKEDNDDLVSEGFSRYHDSIEGTAAVHKDWLNSHMEVFYSSLLASSITVKAADKADTESSITVPPGSNLPSHLFIQPMKDIPSSITINSGYLHGSITVPMHGASNRISTLAVRVRGVSDLESLSGVRSGWLGSHIGVRAEGWNDLTSSIGVRIGGECNVPGDITVRAYGDSDHEGTISARKTRESDLYTNFKVRVWDESQLEGSITIRVWGESDLSTDVGVRVWGKHDQQSSITVRRDDYSDLPSVIDGKQHGNIEGDITVRRDDLSEIPSSISVWEKSILEGSITIKNKGEEDLPGEVFIRSVSQLPSSIDVITAYPYSYIM